jgi:hypothetical protein
MRIQLSEADRERFGCPDWLPIDLSLMTLTEMEAIQKAVGFDSDQDLIEAWERQYKNPDKKFAYDFDAWRVLVWLGLRQANSLTAKSLDEMTTEIVDLDCQILRLRIGTEPEPGKDQTSSFTPTTTSESSETTTDP